MASDRWDVAVNDGRVYFPLGDMDVGLSVKAAHHLAHALLDAIGERDEAEAIVRAVAELHPSDVYGSCLLCGTDNGSAHEDDCPYLRARAFVAREGREDQR